ncbi:MAG: aminotransferase class V-fold PLP-dependent enzyme [Methanomassiliicoccales archaeon]|nr:aminotransferase class V-fold PLP-dependent enzyme [Methanomassiliicoccales archaeon]
MERTYFDNSATTRMDRRVMEEMLPYFDQRYGNASSMHSFGREAYDAIELARERTAKALGATTREVVFTSGGTESDNLAIQGAAFANIAKGRHIITTAFEHHAVLHTCHFMGSQGFRVTYLPVDGQGLVDPEDLKRAMTKETILVSVMAANNEVGTIQPIRELGAIAHEGGSLFHTDAVQSIAKLPVDIASDNIDLISISAHKFHGPKGVGALCVRKGVKLRPVVYGGGQERGLRSSTENVPGIVGLGKAIKIGVSEMEDSVARMVAIRDRLIDGTLSSLEGCFLNGHRTKRLCNNAHFRFDLVEGEALVLSLDMKGFATSTGSACSTRSAETSHVLKALGVRPEDSRGSLRLSLSKFNTMEEAERFLGAIGEIVARLRSMAPRAARSGGA